MDRESLLPKHSLNLDYLECAKLPINGQFRYPLDSKLCANGKLIDASLFGQLNCIASGVALHVFDFVFGTEITLLPERPTKIRKILACISLSSNQGLIAYSTDGTLVARKISFVSLDFINKLYKEEGEPYEIVLGYLMRYGYLSVNRQLFVTDCAVGGDEIHVFDLNLSLPRIESHRITRSPSNSCLFNSIGKEIIFTCLNRIRIGGGGVLGNFRLLQEDGSLVEIKDTSVFVKSATEDQDRASSYSIKNSFQGCWSGRKAFVANNAVRTTLTLYGDKPVSSSFTLLVFDLDIRQWSKIYLPLPLDSVYYQLSVDKNTTMTIFIYDRAGDTTDDILELKLTAIRAALKTPDKLTLLCWLKMQSNRISNNLKHLLNSHNHLFE